MLSDYIAYLYSFLNRKSPNNGSKPISWERFSEEWLEEDGQDARAFNGQQRAMSHSSRYV